MANDFRKMKKIELHLHLDGSVSFDIASALSGKSIDELKKEMIASDKCVDLGEYLTRFFFPISLMQTKKNLELIASDLVEHLDKQNVIYSEIRFAPMFHTKKGLSYEDVVESVLKGLKGNKNVKSNLILCLMRGVDEESNLKTIEIAKKYLKKGVCAIDLAGDEKKYPTHEYKKYFEIAKKENIPFTIHAGEVGGVEEIEIALELGAKRIGHGIQCIKSERIMQMIKDNEVLLEVCPTSNVQTNSIDMYESHPIRELYDNDIEISVNTDNSTVSNISLSKEYEKLYNVLHFSYDDFVKMNISAIKHSFLDDEEKKELLKSFI